MAHREDLIIISGNDVFPDNNVIFMGNSLYPSRYYHNFHKEDLLILRSDDMSMFDPIFMDNFLYPNRKTTFQHYEKLVIINGNEFNNNFGKR